MTDDIHNQRQLDSWYGNETGRRKQDNDRAAAGKRPIPERLAGGASWQSHIRGHKDAVMPTTSPGLLRRDAQYRGVSGRTSVGSNPGDKMTAIQRAEHERELRLNKDWYGGDPGTKS